MNVFIGIRVVGVREILETNNVIKNLSAEKIAFPSVMAQFFSLAPSSSLLLVLLLCESIFQK
jgi:hypothetical protein